MLLAEPIKTIPVADPAIYDTPIPTTRRTRRWTSRLVWIVWFAAAFACLGSGVAVVWFSNPFYSALALIGTSPRSRCSTCC